MPRTTLTEISLRNLTAPAAGQATVWDAMPNFGVRVSQGGTKSFIVLLGSGQRHTIGRYPVISLQEARSEARRLLAERTLGGHRLTTITFERALPLFLTAQYQGKKERSRKETERLLTRHFMPKLRHERLTNITTQKLAEILDALAGTPAVQHNAATAIGTFLRWSIVRRYIPFNPAEGIRYAPGKPRTRVLTDREVAAVWRSTEGSTRFNKIVRLCMLLGQRRGEIALMCAEYIDWKERTITLPAEIVKNGRTHTFPFGNTAAAILRTLPNASYLFPGIGGAEAFNAWGKCKRLLDAEIHIAHWTLHDLRRTFATNLAALGTAPHVVEKVLNHSSGIISGVAAIYNKFQYKNEMKVAIDAWDARLAEIVARPKDVPLQRSAA